MATVAVRTCEACGKVREVWINGQADAMSLIGYYGCACTEERVGSDFQSAFIRMPDGQMREAELETEGGAR